MIFEEKVFKVTGITPILGSVCLDKEVYSKYIATKAATEEEKARAEADTENVIDVEDEKELKSTGFYRAKDGSIILKAYQFKGFLKEAAKALKDQVGLTAYLSKIDNLVFVSNEIGKQEIQILRDGEKIMDPDYFLERPLRAETAKGPRVSLARSEALDDWYFFIKIKVLKNAKTTKSVELDMGVVEELMSYGGLKGLLQWRNASYGSFTVEEVKA